MTRLTTGDRCACGGLLLPPGAAFLLALTVPPDTDFVCFT